MVKGIKTESSFQDSKKSILEVIYDFKYLESKRKHAIHKYAILDFLRFQGKGKETHI